LLLPAMGAADRCCCIDGSIRARAQRLVRDSRLTSTPNWIRFDDSDSLNLDSTRKCRLGETLCEATACCLLPPPNQRANSSQGEDAKPPICGRVRRQRGCR